MPKKAKAKKQRVNGAKLPAGFTAVAVGGSFGEWHDFNKHPVLTGKVVETGSFQGEYGKQRTITVQQGKVASTVSESKALAGLFDTKGLKGKTVFIRFLGAIKIGKPKRNGEQKTFKQFQCGVK
jgi:hypothetical protein